MKQSFPVINSNTKIINSDGTLTAEGVNFFSVNQSMLAHILAASGVKPSIITATDQTSVENNGAKIVSGIAHRVDLNEYVALKKFNGSYRYEKIMTQPL